MARVLIVDDKQDHVYLLEALMEGHGYEVETAQHGAEALVSARANPPDLIVSDLLMPVLDGFSLLRRCKLDERLRHIPFIVYTATYTDEGDRRLALDLGADAFILKPAEPEAFMARVKEVVSRVVEDGGREPDPDLLEEGGSLLKLYSETLIRKLEEKSEQLQEANEALRDDLGARKKIEKSLLESEERFRQLAENIEEVFWITDPDKEGMLYISPAYETIWGRRCESLYEDPTEWLDAVHPEDRARMERAAQEDQASGAYDETYRIVRPDGAVRYIHDRAFPVEDENGSVYRIVGTAMDVTERKKLEKQYLRAQRMESIGTLAGGIAHDLNNLLLPIVMGVDLLRQVIEDPKLLSVIDNIGKSAERGTSLVGQVLSFARGVDGARMPIVCDHVVREVESIARTSFPKNIEIVRQPTSDPWTTLGDPTQLNQVLMNLCVNARDAMPEGGRITISTRNVVIDEQHAVMNSDVTAGKYVVLEVSDEGTGMSRETTDRVFEPFYTSKEVGEGTGLGLPTALGIVKSHGGTITVYSELGRGSVFKVYLPATHESEAESDSGAVAVGARLPRGNNELILVVDDETSILAMTEQTLKTFGYRVLVAEDGAQAVGMYADNRDDIALVLTDMMMPVMDGAALIKALRRMDSNVKVIAASGIHGNHDVLDNGYSTVVAFLEKPYSATELLTAIADVLGGE